MTLGNLVINTDADQIIIATDGPMCRALPMHPEDSFERAEIRRAVCDILGRRGRGVSRVRGDCGSDWTADLAGALTSAPGGGAIPRHHDGGAPGGGV